MTIIELRAKRSKAWEAAKAFAETHTNSNGVLSAEDTQTYERMEQEIVDLGKEIQRRERQEALDAELNMPVNKPLTSSPANAEKPKTGRASNEYKEDFGRHLRGKKPIHNVLSESVDADGGYLVPEEFEKDIVRGIDETNIIRSIAKVITTANDRKIPIAVGHSVATWTAENAAYTEDTELGEGEKTVVVEVKVEEYSVSFTIHTDKAILGDALFEHALIDGEEGPYGLYIKKVNGITADYDADQSYWAFYQNGEYMMTGVDTTEIIGGEHYELVYTK